MKYLLEITNIMVVGLVHKPRFFPFPRKFSLAIPFFVFLKMSNDNFTVYIIFSIQ